MDGSHTFTPEGGTVNTTITAIPWVIDKSTWGPGPWQNEPDRVEWRHAGLPCLAVRHPVGGFWCGYAAVAPGHPYHGVDDWQTFAVDVHQGANYAAACIGPVCHVPAPGDPDDVWWVGFDCGHTFDLAPGIVANLRTIGASEDLIERLQAVGAYRTLAYVRVETERLAAQLAAIGAAGDHVGT